ncbi:hypothetical protein ACFL7D_02360 [candidate division KSB1 bacterium]
MDFISFKNLLPILFLNLTFAGTGLLYLRHTSKLKYLQKAGFSEEFINVTKKHGTSGKIRFLGIFFIIQIIAALIFNLFGYSITMKFYVGYIILPAYFVGWIVIFVYLMLYGKRYQTELKKRVNEAEELVIDFNYKTAKMILNWKLEVPASLILIYFNIMYFDHSPVLYLFSFAPLATVHVLYKMRYQVRKTIQNIYITMSRNTIFSQFSKGILFVAYFIFELDNSLEILNYFEISLAVLFMIYVLGAISTGIKNHSIIKSAFGETAVPEAVV